MSTLNEITQAPSSLSTLLPQLPNLLAALPPTFLPVQLPLAFPSTIHHLNLLGTLHLLYAILSSPAHIPYFAESNPRTSPKDMAIRGSMGLYLASEPDWDTRNLLSKASWKTISTEQIIEFLGVEVMREKEHETMKGIRVGERWVEGSMVADDVRDTLRAVAAGMTGTCLGEELLQLWETCSGDLGEFCSSLSTSIPIPSLASSSETLSLIPLRLLYDLSKSPHLRLGISPSSPLPETSIPLSLPVLLYLGIISLPAGVAPATKIETENELDLIALALSSPESGSSSTKTRILRVDKAVYATMEEEAARACADIHARAGNISVIDLYRVFDRLEEVLAGLGVGVQVVPT
ncbi:hypothetical protein P7C73_g2750, partial [Tremellales sp. Uapishka_1]